MGGVKPEGRTTVAMIGGDRCSQAASCLHVFYAVNENKFHFIIIIGFGLELPVTSLCITVYFLHIFLLSSS